MAKRDLLDPDYIVLTPEERLRATLENLARGNNIETERIVSTCPRDTIVIPTLEYYNRYRGIVAATHFAASFLYEDFKSLALGGYAKDVVVPMQEALAVLFRPRFWKENEGDRITFDKETIAGWRKSNEEIKAFFKEAAASLLGNWQGFADFCDEEIGTPAETVLRAVDPMCADTYKHFRERLKYLEGVEPDTETKTLMYESLKKLWEKTLDRGID